MKSKNMNREFVSPRIDIYKFETESIAITTSEFNVDIPGDGEGWEAADE